MKVLVLNSPWINTDKEYGVKSGTRWTGMRKKDRSMPYFPFPYFIACATAVLKKAGFQAHIKDAIAEEMTREECLEYVRNLKPDLVLIEAFTPSINYDLSFMKEAKERTGCYSVFCGVHSSALPEEILKNDFMDFVLMGEFDYTLRELVSFIASGRRDFGSIKGLAYKENNCIKINPPGELIQNLDALPFPEWDELPMHKYNEPFSKYYPNGRIVTSRGCPYRCIFCVEPFMNNSTYRKRSVDLVLEEIKLLSKKYGIREIFFDDAIFTLARAKEIAEVLLEHNLIIPWSCWIDWNITFEELKVLKRSGCIGVKFGIESAAPEILKAARKYVDIKKIKELLKNCRKLGLLRHASFLFGLPGDTANTMRQTIDLAFSLDLTSCQVAIATPLPGTAFYKIAKEKGWLATENWEEYEGNYSAVVEYPGCSRKDIVAAINLAREKKIKQMFKNPFVAAAYIYKLYKMKGAREFFKELLQKGGFALKVLFPKK